MKLVINFLVLFLVIAEGSADGQKKPSASQTKKVAAQTSTGQAKQKPSKAAVSKTRASSQKKPQPALDDKTELEKATKLDDNAAKVEALKKFIEDFPQSPLMAEARLALSQAAYLLAEENLSVGEAETGVEMLRLSVASAPKPLPEPFFTDSLSRIPSAFFWRGNRAEAIGIAATLESKAEGNAEQLAALSVFYASIENGNEAVRLGEAAVKADPSKARAQTALGLAYRVNFRLEDAASAYARALEADPSSVAIKRSLAEIKRAIGKSDEAVTLYREIAAADPADKIARSGLILALFDAGKIDEAEKELNDALAADSKNAVLLAGAAYWYAAQKNSERAVDLGQRAIAADPRYVWSYIALARGLTQQARPLEAEEVLLKARSYGNFPTLDYELASARLAAGFYRDAVEGLRRSFSLDGETLSTNIGARINRQAASFTELLADERRASILEPVAAEDAESAAKLKQLMALVKELESEKPDPSRAAQAADAFAGGDDKLHYHRQLYSSALLLERKVAVPKALELAESAVGNIDAALSVPNAASFVMASELYESRQIAFSRNELLKVPSVPRQTLSAILRGRVEDLVGWAKLQLDKPQDAAIHFKRAVAILPEKSAWWRAGMWRLGAALQAEGNEQEALETYIKSYSIDKPDLARYTIVEALYKKLNGTTDGLEAKIGPIPLAQITPAVVAKSEEPPKQEPTASSSPGPVTPEPSPAPTVDTDAAVSPSPSPNVVSDRPESMPSPSPATDQSTEAVTLPPLKVEVSPSPTPVTDKPDIAPATVETAPVSTASPGPELTPTPATEPSPTPTESRDDKPLMTVTPASAKPTPSPSATENTEAPSVQPSPTPVAELPALQPTPSPTPLKTEDGKKDPADEEPHVKADVAGGKVNEPLPANVTPTPAAVNGPTAPKNEPRPKPDENVVAEVKKEPPDLQVSKPSEKTNEPPAKKALFDPIVITIPKSQDVNPPTSSEKIQSKTIPPQTRDDRPRLVTGKPVVIIEGMECQISVSQERMSLLNNGGTLSVLVGVDKYGSLGDLKYVISDPSDISVSQEDNPGLIQGRALYIIRSTSERTGTFRVTFYLPCGKRDLEITVR